MPKKQAKQTRDWNYDRARDVQANVRLTAEERDLWDAVAGALGVSRTDAVVEALKREARRLRLHTKL
jgi:uncharacterized protein (DUF1778 family)